MLILLLNLLGGGVKGKPQWALLALQSLHHDLPFLRHLPIAPYFHSSGKSFLQSIKASRREYLNLYPFFNRYVGKILFDRTSF